MENTLRFVSYLFTGVNRSEICAAKRTHFEHLAYGGDSTRYIHTGMHAFYLSYIIPFVRFSCVNLFGRKIGLEARVIRKYKFSTFITLWHWRQGSAGGRRGWQSHLQYSEDDVKPFPASGPLPYMPCP